MRRRTQPIAAVGLALALALALAPSVAAYHLFGGHFASVNDMTYNIEPGQGTISTNGWNAARIAWTATPTPVCICSKVTGNVWDLGMQQVNNSSVGWDGLTDTLPSATYVPTSYAWVYDNLFYVINYTANEVSSVTTHEVGHALGLAHTNGGVLMNPATCGSTGRYCHYGIYTPQQDDINGILALY